ncbi:GMP synthase [glutamine-hydrolyzing]-like [Rosa chinensis]|uniref:GMP synthase [glutamine-hydrolyzing]-like n=1 Tax=Rosa chinensis TaxID=74649 RepID=UPI000D089636|nr:GMP synthase [glutamine-hydrolyzing]-like [Rosa chinensis]
MSHGDEEAKLPHGFEVVGKSQKGVVAPPSRAGQARSLYGLPYHPEGDTFAEKDGVWRHLDTSDPFRCLWSHSSRMELDEEIKVIDSTVAPDDHVICALWHGEEWTLL